MSRPDDPFDFTGYGQAPAGTGAGNPSVGSFDPRPDSGSSGGGSMQWGFDNNPGSSFTDPDPVAGPPVVWLAAVGVAATVGLVLAAVFGSIPAAAVAGWILCGPVAIGLLAVYTAADTRKRARPIYSQPKWVRFAYWGGFALSMVGIVFAALRIAFWVGHL